MGTNNNRVYDCTLVVRAALRKQGFAEVVLDGVLENLEGEALEAYQASTRRAARKEQHARRAAARARKGTWAGRKANLAGALRKQGIQVVVAKAAKAQAEAPKAKANRKGCKPAAPKGLRRAAKLAGRQRRVVKTQTQVQVLRGKQRLAFRRAHSVGAAGATKGGAMPYINGLSEAMEVLNQVPEDLGIGFDFYNAATLASVAEIAKGRMPEVSRQMLCIEAEIDHVDDQAYAMVVLALTCGVPLIDRKVVVDGDVDAVDEYWGDWALTLPKLQVTDDLSRVYVINGGNPEFDDVAPWALTPQRFVEQLVQRSVIDQKRVAAMLTLMGGERRTANGKTQLVVGRGRDEMVYEPSSFTLNGKPLRKGHWVEGLDNTGLKALYFSAWYALQGDSGNTMKGRLAFLTELYADPGHGELRLGSVGAYYDNQPGKLVVEATENLGMKLSNGASRTVMDIVKHCYGQTEPINAIPSHQADSVAVGDEACAGKGLAIVKKGDGYQVVTRVPASTEIKKVINRFALIKASCEAVLEMGAYSSEVVASPVATSTTDGTLVRFHGVRTPVAIIGDCALLNDGSGTALLSPGVTVTVSREVVLTAKVPAAGKSAEDAIAEVKATTFVATECGWNEYAFSVQGAPRAKNRRVATRTIDPGKVEFRHDAKSEQVTVIVPALEVNTSPVAKFAKEGVKAVARNNPHLKVYAAGIYTQQLSVAASIGPEGLKGLHEPFLEMACHRYGVDLVRPAHEGAPAEAKALVNRLLAEADATPEVEVVADNLSPDQFALLHNQHSSNPAYRFLENKATGEKAVVWKGRAVVGDIVLAVENTPVYMSMGKSQLTAEMTLTLSAISPELVAYYTGDLDIAALIELPAVKAELSPEVYFLARVADVDPFEMMGDPRFSKKVGQRYKERCFALQRLLNCVNAKTAPADIPVYEVNLTRNAGVNAKGTDKAIVRNLRKKFRDGLVFRFPGQDDLYLDFDAIEAIGPSDEDGNGYSYVAEVAAFVRFLGTVESHAPAIRVRRTERFFNLMRTHLTSAVADSPRFIARAMRPIPAQVTKVTTMSWVRPGKVHINPNDPRVLKGEIREDDLLDLLRCPVYYGMLGEVVLDAQVPVGLWAVNPLYWHAGNEGDADGDQVFAAVVPSLLKGLVKAQFAQAGWLGPDGYYRLRGVATLH